MWFNHTYQQKVYLSYERQGGHPNISVDIYVRHEAGGSPVGDAASAALALSFSLADALDSPLDAGLDPLRVEGPEEGADPLEESLEPPPVRLLKGAVPDLTSFMGSR